jgi:hypothetical protein
MPENNKSQIFESCIKEDCAIYPVIDAELAD